MVKGPYKRLQKLMNRTIVMTKPIESLVHQKTYPLPIQTSRSVRKIIRVNGLLRDRRTSYKYVTVFSSGS